MADVSPITSSSQKTIEQIIEDQANQAKEAQKSRNTGQLGKDDFLKLLITQVQHQDPMNPSNDTDFIAQMAQFSALEQMQNLNGSFSFSKASGMIGKYVTAQITDETTGETSTVTGQVQSARMNAGKVYVMVNDQMVDVDQVIDISDTEFSSANSKLSEYSGLIGMLGSAWVTNANNEQGTVQGIISSIDKGTDGIYAHLDEVDIEPMDLDMTGYATPQDYVTANAGKTLTFKFKDADTGAEIRVTGTVRNGYTDNDGNFRLVLDDVKVPVDSIYGTKHVDLLSNEEMLLNEILHQLQSNQNADAGSGSTEETGSGTETTDGGTGTGDGSTETTGS